MKTTKAMKALHNRRAVALVIVLAMLVLLSGLLVAFMSTAATERSSTQANAGSLAARQLGDSVVNLVIGQLREATQALDDRTAWASQPGAIRTFSGRLSSTRRSLPRGAYYYEYTPGQKDETFKLYSADRMRLPTKQYDEVDLPEEVSVIENWDILNPPFGYVDMNEPALIPRRNESGTTFTVEPRYPIMDPRATLSRTEGRPSTSNPAIVEGADAKLVDDPNVQTVNGQPVRRLPMPVKWLWVLKDGSVGPLRRATRLNPVIGRIAFWTDDESCKLNINTASEGTFWDTPSVSCENEAGQVSRSSPFTNQSSPNSYALAASQPVRGEYQRYPGHPATTCLSPAIGWMWPGFNPYGSVKNMAPGYANFKDALAGLLPFLPNGPLTTRGGTHNPSESLPFAQEPKLPVLTRHLYASIDELAFKEPPNAATPGRVESNPITPEALEKLRFFLTTNSRAPELNLFGRPRVTIWPVHNDIRDRTTFDDLFAFTSTIVGKQFYLGRHDARSATEDVKPNSRNIRLYEYLQAMTGDRLTEIPGFGGNFKNKYGSGPLAVLNNDQVSLVPNVLERDQILTLMFDFMRTVNLVDTGTASKTGNQFRPYTPFYGPITYSHSIHPNEWSGQVTPTRIGVTAGFGRFPIVSEVALIFNRRQKPQAPAGSFQMQAVLALEMATVMPGYPGIRETYFTRVRALRPLQLSFPGDTQGTNKVLDMGLCSSGAWDGTGNFYPQHSRAYFNIPNVPAHEVAGGRGFQTILGWLTPMYYYNEGPNFRLDPYAPNPNTDVTRRRKTFMKHVSTLDPDPTPVSKGNYARNATVRFYPYVSDWKDVPPVSSGNANSQRFNLENGGTYRIEIFSGEAPGDPRQTLVQTIDVSFPGTLHRDFPEPSHATIPPRLDYMRRPVANIPYPPVYSQPEYGLRLTDNADGFRDTFMYEDHDFVRGMEAYGLPAIARSQEVVGMRGDLRLVAARSYVPPWMFTPRGDLPGAAGASGRYFSPTEVRVHSLQNSHGEPNGRHGSTSTDWVSYPANSAGRLTRNGTIRTTKPPMLPAGVNGVIRSIDGGPGDWSRGISKNMSGAFGGKVDEGNVLWGDILNSSDSGALPYFRGKGIEETGQSFFSPNRQVASAVVFGSLPTGVIQGHSWQTLLFRPDRELSTAGHPGAKAGEPPDYLWLDLFHMPVVEPYAISEPLSTGGKVNLNYVIAPFGYARGESGNNPNTAVPRSYIRRDTALRGVLKSVKIMAVPTGMADNGHREAPLDDRSTIVRYDIDLDRTLEQIESRLKTPTRGLFRSASEICEVDLFPQGIIPSDWRSFWDNQFAQTGDNKREVPYAHIYPRVTTQSNVFTVHMRCQSVKLKPGVYNDQGRVDEESVDERDVLIQGEYRGSATVERFIDPNDPLLKMNYTNEVDQRLEPYYRYRVVHSKQFLPQ